MLGGATNRAFPLGLEGVGLQVGTQQLDDRTGFDAELFSDGVERGTVLPRHLDDAIDLGGSELSFTGRRDCWGVAGVSCSAANQNK